MTQLSIWRNLRLTKNKIRLLTVNPSTDAEENISCALSIVNLDHKPTYVALSYTWGDPTMTVPILVDGKPWQITSNLDDALRCLRDTSKPLTIFVDALCIDQKNIDEKNSQVPLMGRIYRQSKMVHCWIGRADTDTTRAPMIFTRTKGGVVDLDEYIEGGPISLADMKSLAHFLSMPYWKRAWIIQEIVLAPQAVFHYGKHQFSKQDVPHIADAMSSIWTVQERFLQNPPTTETPSLVLDITNALGFDMQPFLSVIANSSDGKLSRATPGRLVGLTKQAASLKHDHVYAFLSILSPELQQRIKPDYRLGTAQVFRDFAFQFMQVTGSSRLLSYAVGLTDNPLGLPLWTPDFSNENEVSLSDGWFHANERAWRDVVMDEDGCLGVAAFCLDRVTVVRSVCAPELRLTPLRDNPKEAALMHMEWRKFFGLNTETDSLRLYAGGGTLEEAYWRTMCRDRVAVNGTASDTRWLVQDDIRSMSAWLRQVVQRPDAKISTMAANTAWAYNSELMRLALYRVRSNANVGSPPGPKFHIFRTAKGYIGLTSRSTPPQINDEVYLIAGSAAPALLRRGQPGSHGKATFRLVNHAYVAGLMLRTVLPEAATLELPVLDYQNHIHPHMKVATSWDRIWLR